MRDVSASACVWPPSQVDYEGGFPIEGAKEVSTVMTRHVSRQLRSWSQSRGVLVQAQAAKGLASRLWQKSRKGGLPPDNYAVVRG
jgi:hypothetical protein